MTDALMPLYSRLAEITTLSVAEVEEHLTQPPKPELGDYAFPCFPLAKVLKKSPAQIAGELAAKLEPDDVITEAKAAGPYINIRLNRQPIVDTVLTAVRARGAAYGGTPDQGKTVVIDYSSPNMAKPFHVGHLSSTIIGGSLSKLYDFAGWNVIRVNHLGDWGTPIGMQLAAFQRWGNEDELAANPIEHVLVLYQRFHREKEDDATLMEEAREWFRKLETGDEEARSFWQNIRSHSIEALEKTYARLGVGFDYYHGEAFYEDMLDDTLSTISDAHITRESDGALIVPLEDKGMETPLIVRKSDGGTTYATRDLAAAMFRQREHAFDRCLYVVARDQELHFQQLFATLELMKFDWADRVQHVKFGHVHGMSTRKGGAILLAELIDRATDKVSEVITDNQESIFGEVPAEEIAAVAEAVGIGAIIFGTLNRKRNKDIEFSWDNALTFNGETGPYVQYAHARLCSILRKANRDIPESPDFTLLSHDAEWALVKQLSRFPGEITAACEACEPSFIARYLLDLSQALTKFYDQCRVLGDDENLTGARLALVDCVREVIHTGLGLLCIRAPERM
jgi:arginyl-tRNA synthetase